MPHRAVRFEDQGMSGDVFRVMVVTEAGDRGGSGPPHQTLDEAKRAAEGILNGVGKITSVEHVEVWNDNTGFQGFRRRGGQDWESLTHRPTGLPGGNAETDRAVVLVDRVIARVQQIEQGEKAGQWSWSGMWISADNRGEAPTLDDALAEVKKRVSSETLAMLPP